MMTEYYFGNPTSTVSQATLDEKIAMIVDAVKNIPASSFVTFEIPAPVWAKILKRMLRIPSQRRSWREYRRRNKGCVKADWLEWKWGYHEIPHKLP